MKLTLPADLDVELLRLAKAEHTTKGTLVIEAIRALVEARQQRAVMTSTLHSVLAEDLELMNRLGDA